MMKRKFLLVTVVLMLLVMSISLMACGGEKRDIYPAWVYDNVWEEEEEISALPDTSNLRIMSYNILVEAWNKRIKTGISNPMDARVEQVSKVIEHYSPDVVGLQETCEKWHSKLPKKLENYTFVKSFDGMFDYTSMIYNHNKVNLIESDKVAYTKRSEKKMRYAAWALFEKKDTKEKFVVINTHFDFGKEKTAIQTQQMVEFGTLGKELAKKHSAPVFLIGDYNAYETKIEDEKSPIFDWTQGVEHYEKFAKDHGDTFVDANYVDSAEKFGGEHRKYDEPKWDHIFVTKDVAVQKYAILSNDFYTTASDHFPIFVDVAI